MGQECNAPAPFFMLYMRRSKTIKLVIDQSVLKRYFVYYFEQHPRAHKEPIAHPYHESMNQWMIMKRPMMNALKQKWKDFIVWFIKDQGHADLRIDECELVFITYYSTDRPHDVDNSCPKFIIDGLCLSGFVVDDSSKHIKSLTLRCDVDHDRPRTEIYVKVISAKGEE